MIKTMKPKLIIMIGNIASGKSTWIENFLMVKAEIANHEYIIVSKNAIRRMYGAGAYIFNEKLEGCVHVTAIDAVQNLMSLGVNIIIDETNMDKQARNIWLSLTTKIIPHLGYNYHTIAACLPFLERGSSLGRRLQGKESAWGSSREIWARVWDNFNSIYEKPKQSEGFDEIWGIQTQIKENHR